MIACLFVERRQLWNCQHEHDDDDDSNEKRNDFLNTSNLKPHTIQYLLDR